MHYEGPVFRRLLAQLRPQWGRIALGILLLLMAAPCELFPAMAWMYATDTIVLVNTEGNPWLHALFSLGGRLEGWTQLLPATLVILFVVYLIGETLETLSNNLMQRVAQRFILDFRNRVYRKLQSQSLGYLQRQKTGDLMSRAMGNVDELNSFIVGGIDVILGEGLLWIATVVIVFSLDWKVAGASLAPLLVV